MTLAPINHSGTKYTSYPKFFSLTIKFIKIIIGFNSSYVLVPKFVKSISHLIHLFFLWTVRRFLPLHPFIALINGLFSSFYSRWARRLYFHIINKQRHGDSFNKIPNKNIMYPAAFLLKAIFSSLIVLYAFFCCSSNYGT